MKILITFTVGTSLFSSLASARADDLAVRGNTVYTMAGDPLSEGVVLIHDGRISAVGKAADVPLPEGIRTVTAAVVMPGIIDARTTVGLSGILNYDHDQEQLEKSAPMQPELRAIDAYNARDPLVRWLRELGVTTVNTGHAPGALISGQTMIVKTDRQSIDETAVVRPYAMLAGSLGPDAMGEGGPGTRAKAVAMLRAQLLKARDFVEKSDNKDKDKDKDKEEQKPARDLGLEALASVLRKEVPLAITVHRHQDITAALRIAREFGFNLILDGASEAHLVLDDIKSAGVPVLVHATMQRPAGDAENMTFTLARQLHEKEIPFAFQSGHEGYVPKVRVVLFEAAMAATYGLPREAALAGMTINAATLLGIADQTGSLQRGKAADLALFDGDPLEFTTHCTGVIIDGEIVFSGRK